ncbi:hypothetical protein [Liquorilactobacillus vini]|uniref:Uncharacterized protein n=1 Tax=Liquorilactobacillus vini DSM 20605 TaxID=1133569 RepID=A0A0R2C470_9LACO|nr:hypothetical protein [Liquorilactobacillus vini]KRM86408.1 hypothetical protein FD21_GL001530 [Liquorilactobacillus vini DSM 20605]
MAEFSAVTQRHILEKNDFLTADFLGSYLGKTLLRNGIAEETIRTITYFFVEANYNYYLRVPKRWTKASTERVLVDEFPRHVAFSVEEAHYIAPTLINYVIYLDTIGYIRNGAALKNAIEEATPELIENAGNPALYGPGKKFALAAIQAGIDLTDKKAILEYMQKYNEQFQQDFENDPENYDDFGDTSDLDQQVAGMADDDFLFNNFDNEDTMAVADSAPQNKLIDFKEAQKNIKKRRRLLKKRGKKKR